MVRNCAEIGENIQKIIKIEGGLMGNDNLVKLLYYSDKDPLSQPALTEDEKKNLIYNKFIRIIPKVTDKETAQSIIVLKVMNSVSINNNTEFRTVNFDIEVFVPMTQWLIKNGNLRPFSILGEIQKTLNNKIVNGLGKMTGGDFELTFLTEEVSCYTAHYSIINYD